MAVHSYCNAQTNKLTMNRYVIRKRENKQIYIDSTASLTSKFHKYTIYPLDKSTDHPPEVILEAVSHKLNTLVHQVSQFHVGTLQGGQVFLREVGIQVSWFDARELGQVVHNLFLC